MPKEADFLFGSTQDISVQFRYLHTIRLSGPIEAIEWVVPQMSNLRSLKVWISSFCDSSDFSFLQSCPKVESFSLSARGLEPNQCKQFSNLKSLTAIDLKLTSLTSEAMFVLLLSLPLTVRRFRHSSTEVMSHFDVVVDRFPHLEEFSVGSPYRESEEVWNC